MSPSAPPDFLLRYRLVAVASELFSEEHWIQPTGIDEDLHEVIQTMRDVGLIDQGIGLVDGVQIVVYRLRGDE